MFKNKLNEIKNNTKETKKIKKLYPENIPVQHLPWQRNKFLSSDSSYTSTVQQFFKCLVDATQAVTEDKISPFKTQSKREY